MNEMLLQFIWQYSLYNPVNLKTLNGEPVIIVHPGKKNVDAGPDFEEARVRIGNTMLVGNVEIHLRSSDWHKHGHEKDESYKNIILHVVLENDGNTSNQHFETIEIGKHIPDYITEQYRNLIQTTRPIACSRQISTINSLIKESWLNRLLAERWEQKLSEWKDLLNKSTADWQKLLYWRLAANFGFKVNTTPFLMLAISLPVNILAKHKQQLFQIEALLFGQAGMLDDKFKDDYPNQLKAEYAFLKHKYSLRPVPVHLWKFLRMRPPNFPTIRIAQFASLVYKSLHLFSGIIANSSVKEIHTLLAVTASEYWNAHYRFDEPAKKVYPKMLGDDSIDNIIINTIAPVQFLFAHYHSDMEQQEAALNLLTSVPPEQNKFIRLWQEHGWKASSAAHSQAMLQLFNRYCSQRKCLECAIGLNLIKSAPVKTN